jgi:hypothetical protein
MQNGATPLHVAAQNGHPHVVEYLVSTMLDRVDNELVDIVSEEDLVRCGLLLCV